MAKTLTASNNSQNIGFLKINGLIPVLRRLLAYFCDLSLSYFAFYYFSSFGSFYGFYQRFVGIFEGRGFDIVQSELLSTIFIVFVVNTIIQFYSSLFFGVSLFQLVFGMRSSVSGIWGRVSSGARVVLDFVLIPLVFTKIPIVFGKRSISETLAGNKIVESGGLLSASAILISPLIVGLSIFAPLLQNLTLIDGLKVNFEKSSPKSLKGMGNFDDFKLFTSNKFKLSALSNTQNDRFVFIPSFEVRKKDSKKTVRPYLIIYDRKFKNLGELKIASRLKMLDLFEKARIGNPLFQSRYNQINSAINDRRERFEIKNFQTSNLKKFTFTDELITQSQSLIQSSLELSPSSLVGHVLENGPFLRGFINIRNSLLKVIDSSIVPEVDLIKIGNMPFLRFKQLYNNEAVLKLPYIETLIPVGTHNSVVFEYQWGKKKEDAISRKDFYDSFLNNAQWYFDYSNIFNFPKNEPSMTSFDIIDYYLKKGLNPREREQLEEFVFHYFFDLSRKSLLKNDQQLSDTLTAAISRMYLVANIKNRQQSDFFSKKYLNLIIELKNALENKDKKYFTL